MSGASDDRRHAASDVTEALRESEERYKTLFDQAPVGVVVYDADLVVRDCNACACEIFRSSRETMIGLDLHRVRDTAILPTIAEVFEGKTTSYEGPYVANFSGVRLHISVHVAPLRDAHGRVAFGMAFIEDVTTRKIAEDALKTSETRFRTLIEHAPDAICVTRDGIFLYVNPPMAAYLGYASPGDLIGRCVRDILHAEDRAIQERRTNLVPQSPALLPPQEYRAFRTDGQMVYCEVVSMAIEYDGAPAILAMSRDLTERKHMQARLLQSDRMASVGTLAAGVAHEINNPLAYVMANLDVLATRRIPQLRERARALEEERADEEREANRTRFELTKRLEQVAQMIELAREGAERVRIIVRDLKTFSRADDETRAPVDVERVLEASVNMAWNEIRHRARLVRDYGQLPPVIANESRLGQVFLNLLVNAAQAIPEGHASEHEIRLRTYTDRRSYAVVSVTDTGAGIAREALARVFDPFYTTKPVGVGTGLGLWICQGIVASLGGDIQVESVATQGTTVTVSLPSRYAPFHAAPVPAARATPSARRGRILVIDDEPALGPSLAIALSDEHDVVAATSGREALELLRRDARFDLVLCDLMMPDVTGMEVFETLRAELPVVAEKVVFVTGGSFTRRSSEFLEQIASRSLEKPFDLQRVRELVRERVQGR